MNEKQAIEWGTAEGFLLLYNERCGTDFTIVEIADAPDVRCADSCGNALNLEITMTEDRAGDIKALLGRSSSRSLEALRARSSSLSNEVSDALVERLKSKFKNDYGHDAALVVRDSSGVDWDWNVMAPDIRNRLNLANNPFGRGIWLLSRAKNRLFKIA